jgi:MFS family permease
VGAGYLHAHNLTVEGKRIVSEQHILGVNGAVIALSLARLGDAVGNSLLVVVIPLYAIKLPSPWLPFSDPVRTGILISVFGIVNALLQPVVGGLSDRFGRRKLFIQVGLALMAVSTLLFTWAGKFTYLLLLRALQGIGVALTVAASISLMASFTEKSTRGSSMGLYTALRMVGFAIGPVLGGFLHDRFGFDVSFYAGTAFILLGWVMVQLWVRKVPQAMTRGEKPKLRFFDSGFLSSGLVSLAFASFAMAAAFSMVATLENEFNVRLHQTALAFGVGFSALTASRLLFQFPAGWLSDRVGRKVLVLAGLGLMAAATPVLGFARTTLGFTSLRVLQGIASAGIAAPAFALAADLAAAGSEGRQMSLVTMGFGLGIALGPLIAGLLSPVFFELPFFVGGLLSLAGVWVVYRHVPETVESR